MLGGQVVAEVVAEIDGNAVWQRGYVYAGSNLMAVQQGGVFWTYEDPITKSKRVCDVNGNIVSTVELDPWGADTSRSSNQAFQPHKYTTYERDGNGSDEAMFRRYNRWHSRFDQPDPYNGSYNATDPQSFNRYSYTQNDPVNFVDPSGLEKCKLDNGQWVECGEFDSSNTVTVNTFGYSVLPAWMSGHSPMIIGLLPGDPTPREIPLIPQNPQPTKPAVAEPASPTKQSRSDCMRSALRKYLGDQAEATALTYSAWTGMGFLTLAIALSGGAAESGELLELAHIGEADSRIAVGYVPLILGVEKGLRDHVVNYQQYKAALKACRSQ